MELIEKEKIVYKFVDALTKLNLGSFGFHVPGALHLFMVRVTFGNKLTRYWGVNCDATNRSTKHF